MINVECKECPIRNFCLVYQLENRPAFYDQCPLFRLAQSTSTFFKAAEKLENMKYENPKLLKEE